MPWRIRYVGWKPRRLFTGRILWHSPDLNKKYSSSFLWDLIINEERKHRFPTNDNEKANLISSYNPETRKHYPIIDLDWAHQYIPSSHEGHAHLLLDVETSRWRWVCLMFGLWIGRVISFGYFAWSLRRGQNFARLPHIKKEHAKWEIKQSRLSGSCGDGPYN